jgi:hypothetical protein
MNYETIIPIIALIIGTILIYLAGQQDLKTRKPILLIPALLYIGLSSNMLTALTLTIISILIFISPKKINDHIGKADLLIFISIPLLVLLATNPMTQLLFILTNFITLLLLIDLLIKTPKQQRKTLLIPLIYYYSIGFILSLMIIIISGCLIIIKYLITGVI